MAITFENELTPHPDNLAYAAILVDLLRLTALKQKDYGSDEAPFANVMAAEDFGWEAWHGGALRMNDKMRRIAKAVRLGPENIACDSVEDDLIDMANYAIITLVLYRKQSR